MLGGGAYYAVKYYVYRLIVSRGNVEARFSDLRLSLFPLGVQVRNIRNFPIRDENLVSFAAVHVHLPPAALFMKKKAVSIEIDRPHFVLDDRLLKPRPRGGGSPFSIDRVRIRNGELVFKSGEILCQLLDFNLQSGSLAESPAFRLDSPHLKVTLPISGEAVTLEGNLIAEVHRQGTSWRITRLSWQTREANVSLHGRIFANGTYQLRLTARGDPGNILRPLLGDLAVEGLTYANARIARNVKQKVQIIGDFASPSCRIKANSCSDLSGTLNWNSQSRHLDLEAAFSTPLTRSSLRLGSRGRETSITLKDIPAAAMADILDIGQDAPLAGKVVRGTVEIDPEAVRGHAELDGLAAQPLEQPFVFQGAIDFLREKKARQVTFSGRALKFNGGEISISGHVDGQAKTTRLRIDAALRDLEHMAAYSAYYLDIDLRPWNLNGGGGAFELELNRRPGSKRIDSRLRLERFLANRQAIAELRGEVRHTPERTNGTFIVSAPDLRSRAELTIAGRRSTILFRDVTGEAQKITRILGLDLDLRGAIGGDFSYSSGKALQQPEVTGRFTAPRLVFLGHALEQVSSSLASNLENVALKDLDFRFQGGRGRADVAIDYAARRFSLQGRIEDIDASRVHGEFSGRIDLEARGAGEFMKDPLELAFRFRDMHYYRDRGFTASSRAEILTDFSDFRLTAKGEALHDTGASPFTLEVERRAGRYSGSYQLELKNLDMLIPWKNNEGDLRLLGQIHTGADGGIASRGVAIFTGRTLSLPNFSHSLDDFQGTVTFADGAFSLQSLSGQMGGGKVEGNGRLVIKDGELGSMTFYFQGKDLRLYPMDRTSCLVNPDLTLKYEDQRLLLSGTLTFRSVEWQREIDEPIVFSTHAELTTAESKIQEMLQLDIAMNGDNIVMNNSLGRIQGRFKLRLTGNASFPILSGTCEGNQGEIYFSDRPFNVLKAKLVFNNKFFIDPLIQVESEAFVQNYRIRFDIRGSASRAKPELASSPPLPPQDILALVSLGEVFKRTGSLEISSREGGAALVATKLTEEIKNRANKLLGIDMLRIDPVFSGQSTLDTSRLTIGKTISKDLLVVYSTNLSTSRQEILYLQYQLSPAISLIAMRNEEGRYSLDLRLRSRR
ncbi:MAG: translocation/assembly module TamB domain-containing protein [Candidatus Aminicenantes bacterium]|nr:translocation/assembly module TamB domain-containing protein [Candidatus Aminicenantes bacterium]